MELSHVIQYCPLRLHVPQFEPSVSRCPQCLWGIGNIGFKLSLIIPLLPFICIGMRSQAASMQIQSLTGPVTQTEINSFKTYMATQVPAPTPWGALSGSGHNDWADGASGSDLEAFGMMYEVTGDITIL